MMKLNNKGSGKNIIFEVAFIIFSVILVLLIQSFYTNSLFLAGVLQINDNNYDHACSTILPSLVGNEYIRASGEEPMQAVALLYEQLGINRDDIRMYPTATYLLGKSPYVSDRAQIIVSIPNLDVYEASPKITGGVECKFLIYGVKDQGEVVLKINIPR